MYNNGYPAVFADDNTPLGAGDMEPIRIYIVGWHLLGNTSIVLLLQRPKCRARNCQVRICMCLLKESEYLEIICLLS